MTRKRKAVETNEEKLFKLRMSVGELSRKEMEIQKEKNKTMKAIKSLLKKVHQHSTNPYNLTVIEETSVVDVVDLVFGDESNKPTNEPLSSSSAIIHDVENDNSNDKSNDIQFINQQSGAEALVTSNTEYITNINTNTVQKNGRIWSMCQQIGSQRELSDERLNEQLENTAVLQPSQNEEEDILLSSQSSSCSQTSVVVIDKCSSESRSDIGSNNASITHVTSQLPAVTTSSNIEADIEVQFVNTPNHDGEEIICDIRMNVFEKVSIQLSHILSLIHTTNTIPLSSSSSSVFESNSSSNQGHIGTILNQCQALQSHIQSLAAQPDKINNNNDSNTNNNGNNDNNNDTVNDNTNLHIPTTSNVELWSYEDDSSSSSVAVPPITINAVIDTKNSNNNNSNNNSNDIGNTNISNTNKINISNTNNDSGKGQFDSFRNISDQNDSNSSDSMKINESNEATSSYIKLDGKLDVLASSTEPKFHLYDAVTLSAVASHYGLIYEDRPSMIRLLQAMWRQNHTWLNVYKYS